MAPKVGTTTTATTATKMWTADETMKQPQIKIKPHRGGGGYNETTQSELQKNRQKPFDKTKIAENTKQDRKCSCNQAQLKIPAKVQNTRIRYGRSMSVFDVRVERKPHRSLSTADIQKPKTKAESAGSVANLVKQEKEEAHLSTYTKVLNYLRKWRRSMNSKSFTTNTSCNPDL